MKGFFSPVAGNYRIRFSSFPEEKTLLPEQKPFIKTRKKTNYKARRFYNIQYPPGRKPAIEKSIVSEAAFCYTQMRKLFCPKTIVNQAALRYNLKKNLLALLSSGYAKYYFKPREEGG